jgi:hypothetical protein
VNEIPWTEIFELACGVFTGFVYARTAHLFRIVHQRGYKSHCAWCGGHLVDLRAPDAQESMKQHVVACAARTAVRP